MDFSQDNLDKIEFNLLSKFKSNCWIAGGAITDCLMDESIRDIDIFFPSEQTKQMAKEVMLKLGARLVHEYPLGVKMQKGSSLYDLLHLGSTPEECIQLFDYTVCSIAIDKKKKIYFHSDYFEHMSNMELHYMGNHPSKHYTNKAKRLRKYLRKGFSLDRQNLELWVDKLINEHKKPKKKVLEKALEKV
jgi:hypothetical protein